MNNNISNKITENQYRALLHSSMIAIGILALPQEVSNTAHQQGWIGVIIGGIYPLFVVIISSYIYKKMKNYDFWQINKKIYGKILTYIITLIFFIIFIFITTSILAGFSYVFYVMLISYIPQYIVLAVVTLLTLYAAINGLTNIGRLCEVYYYLIIGFIVLMLFLIPYGDMNNVKPFYSSLKGIISSIPSSFYAYTGIELSYIALPFIANNRNAKKAGIIAVLTVVFIYTLNVFITIYILGWEQTSKMNYPFLYVLATIHLPVIEDLRAVFLFLWASIIFKTLSCNLFGATYCFSKIINIEYKKSCITCSLIIFLLSFYMIPEYNVRSILDTVTTCTVIFTVIWGLITSVVILLKKSIRKG